MNSILTLLALILALSIAACDRSGDDIDNAARDKTTQTETALPQFVVQDLEGANINSAQFQGKVLIIDFWATWCGPCLTEIPAYNALNKKYADQNFHLLGIALSSGDAATLKPFAQKHNMEYPVYVGSQDAAAAFGNIAVMPTTFVLDQNGAIVKAIKGAGPGKIEQLDALIAKLLKTEVM